MSLCVYVLDSYMSRLLLLWMNDGLNKFIRIRNVNIFVKSQIVRQSRRKHTQLYGQRRKKGDGGNGVRYSDNDSGGDSDSFFLFSNL